MQRKGREAWAGRFRPIKLPPYKIIKEYSTRGDSPYFSLSQPDWDLVYKIALAVVGIEPTSPVLRIGASQCSNTYYTLTARAIVSLLIRARVFCVKLDRKKHSQITVTIFAMIELKDSWQI